MRRPHPLSLILIVLWLTSMAIFVTAPFKLLILLLLCVLGVLMFSGLQASALAKSLLKLLPLLFGVFIIQVLATRGGTELFTLGFVSITDAGLLRALGLMLRVSIIFISAKILARLSYVEFDDAFRKLGLPDEAGFMVAYAAHLIPGITRDLRDKRVAVSLRGIDIRHLALRDRIKIYKVIALDISANLLRNVDIRAIALELRGFRSAGKSSRLQSFPLGAVDLLSLLLLIAITITLYLYS